MLQCNQPLHTFPQESNLSFPNGACGFCPPLQEPMWCSLHRKGMFSCPAIACHQSFWHSSGSTLFESLPQSPSRGHLSTHGSSNGWKGSTHSAPDSSGCQCDPQLIFQMDTLKLPLSLAGNGFEALHLKICGEELHQQKRGHATVQPHWCVELTTCEILSWSSPWVPLGEHWEHRRQNDLVHHSNWWSSDIFRRSCLLGWELLLSLDGRECFFVERLAQCVHQCNTHGLRRTFLLLASFHFLTLLAAMHELRVFFFPVTSPFQNCWLKGTK